MKKYLSILLVLVGSYSSASEINPATIKRLMFDRFLGNNVFIELNVHQDTPEACHTNSSWEFVLDISDDLGKSIYSSLLTLYATQQPALFRGTGSCTLYNSIEDLRRLELK